jgi:hypothetical protein
MPDCRAALARPFSGSEAIGQLIERCDRPTGITGEHPLAGPAIERIGAPVRGRPPRPGVVGWT